MDGLGMPDWYFHFIMNLSILTARLLLILLISSSQLSAANVLYNPGFESGGLGENQNFPGWKTYGANTYCETAITGSPAHGGTNYLKVYQSFTGALNYDGIYQDYISGPGATYTADGWMKTSSADSIAGQNLAWIEVSFRDANGNVLAVYTTAKLGTNLIQSGTFPKDAWVHMQVTNNAGPSLIAPDGTYFVRYQVVFQGDAAFSSGSVFMDDLSLNPTGTAPYGNWNVVWDDEFSGTAVNTNFWTYDRGHGEEITNSGWGNGELEYYTSRTNNAFVAGGLLHIVARKENTNTIYGTFNFTSARMKTQGLASWKYGRFEWRARMPGGVGFWPALWVLGTNINTVVWPGCGEIDVTENNSFVSGNVRGSLHCSYNDGALTQPYDLPGGDSVTNFHTYTLDWATNSFLWYVDGRLYEIQTNWNGIAGNYPTPFDKPFFMLMNLAVGGNYTTNVPSSVIASSGVFPADFQIDYVRVYNQTQPLLLSVTHTNKNVTLSWPTNIVAHLQTQVISNSSSPGSAWMDVVIPTNPLRLMATNTGSFFRLTSP